MDFSWSELLVIGVVALIVIGPKDLPGMFRELGRFTAKIRAMGREFSRAMDQAARESGVKDVADDLKKVASPKSMGLDAVKSAADKFEKWDPLKNNNARPSGASASASPTPPPMPAAMAPAAVATGAGSAAAGAVAAAESAKPEPAPKILGPETAALAEKQAARKAAAAEAAAKLRRVSAGAAELEAELAADAAPVATKKPGRVRKKAAGPAAGDVA